MKEQKGYYKNYRNIIGKVIFDISILSFHSKNEKGNVLLNCKCSCGKEFIRLFSDINKKSTSKSCGCKLKKVYSDAGSTNRKFSINKDKLIDNEYTAYIAGLLGADGYFSGSKIDISLQVSDLEILNKIKQYLEFSGNIYKYKRCCRLSITDKDYIEFFNNRGIISQKTLNYKVPPLFNDNPHFWRGFIDGDGCIHITKHNRIHLNICGTYDTVFKFKEFCNKYANNHNILYKRKSENFYTYAITGKKAKIILDIIYKDANIYMERKFKIYKNKL